MGLEVLRSCTCCTMFFVVRSEIIEHLINTYIQTNILLVIQDATQPSATGPHILLIR